MSNWQTAQIQALEFPCCFVNMGWTILPFHMLFMLITSSVCVASRPNIVVIMADDLVSLIYFFKRLLEINAAECLLRK